MGYVSEKKMSKWTSWPVLKVLNFATFVIFDHFREIFCIHVKSQNNKIAKLNTRELYKNLQIVL